MFDLDNTLVDRDGAWAAVLRARRPGLDAATFARAMAADDHGRRPRAEYQRWLEENLPGVLGPNETWAELATEIVARVEPFEDAPPALERLQADFRLGLVSDGTSAVQRGKLSRTGLERFFEVIVISEEAGATKPDPRPFWLALEGLGVPPEKAWFVGDHPVKDVAGARALGMHAVWRRHGAWPDDLPAPDLVVDSLEELRP